MTSKDNQQVNTTRPYKHVLVVDDNPAIVAAVATRLLAVGWECLTALDGYDAMALMGKHPVDAVVTDLDMPYVDGFGILERATTCNHCPAMVITGSMESAKRCEADFPSVPVLMKPFDSKQVIAWLETLDAQQGTQSAA